ncbi:MAG: hypothetical protein JWO67_4341 [Streptosporangiaceae bacterium]|nr:hypothetical protein [Streptosporangiaceae bacterium]
MVSGRSGSCSAQADIRPRTPAAPAGVSAESGPQEPDRGSRSVAAVERWVHKPPARAGWSPSRRCCLAVEGAGQFEGGVEDISGEGDDVARPSGERVERRVIRVGLVPGDLPQAGFELVVDVSAAFE